MAADAFRLALDYARRSAGPGLGPAGLSDGELLGRYVRVIGAALMLAAVSGTGLWLMAGRVDPAVAAAGPPDDRPPASVEPLPDGAVVRMGSTRLRHAGLNSYAFRDCGKQVVTAGSDGVLRFWDTASGRQVREVRFEGNPRGIQPGRMSADGKFLLACRGGIAAVWEVDTGKRLKALTGQPDSEEVASMGLPIHPSYLWFSPDSKTVAELMGGSCVKLREWQSGTERMVQLPKRKSDVDSAYHFEFSPDGRWFAAGGGYGEALSVYERATGKEVHHFRCNATASAFFPDSKRLAVACLPGRDDRSPVLRVFDLPAGNEVAQFTPDGQQYCLSLTFSPDGKTLNCGCVDGNKLVDSASGEVIHHIARPPFALSFSPDGKMLAGTVGPRLRLWDSATGKELHGRPGDFGPGVVSPVSPDGRHLAAANWTDQSVSVWDIVDGRLVGHFSLQKNGGCPHNLAFSADGRTLVGAGYGVSGDVKSVLKFMDIETGAVRRSVELDDPNPPAKHFDFRAHFPSDGKSVARIESAFDGGEHTNLTVWEADRGKLVTRHALPFTASFSVWQADGKAVALVAGSGGRTGLTLLDVDSGETRFGTAGAYYFYTPLAASPDYRLLAAVRNDVWKSAVVVWETATGKEVAVLPTDSQTMLATNVALTPDDRHLVTTDAAFLRVIDLATGKETWRRPLPVVMADVSGKGYVNSLLLPGDGRRAVTVLADGTALVWDLRQALARAAQLAAGHDERALAAWWDDLAAEDAARAYGAVWRMAEVPPEIIVPFLGRHLRSIRRVDEEKVRRLVADLDSDTFTVREKATEQLKELGNAARPALRRALQAGPSAEAKRRLESLAAQLPRVLTSPDERHRFRAARVLEQIGTKEARGILAELAKSAGRGGESR
jgi:WD40 repeat protein